MLADLTEGIQGSYALWNNLSSSGHRFDFQPTDEAIEILGHLHKHLGITNIERLLATETVLCPLCSSKREPLSSGDEEDDNSMPLDMYQHMTVPKNLRNRHKEMKDAHCRPLRKAMALHQLIPLEPRAFEILPRSRFRDFDDYINGPSLEDLKMFQQQAGPDSQPCDWHAQPTVCSPWEPFRDWGYRVEPEFALMFPSQKPQKVFEHFLPAPRMEEPPIDVLTDPAVEVMGMEDMLRCAGLEGSKESMDLFIKGLAPGGKWVKFDPRRDSKELPLDDIVLSSDIDSIIVTTHKLKVLGDVDIEVLPYAGRRPPIPKSNHTYIELLMPQSEEDLASPGRTEWFSTRHSVSTVPHTHFGKIGYFKISIHFPRMKHRDPITNRTMTLIPWEVQNLFLTDLLYPAIIAGENPSTLLYKDYTLAEWKWKASNNTRFWEPAEQ